MSQTQFLWTFSLKWYNITNTVCLDILPEMIQYQRNSLCGHSSSNSTIRHTQSIWKYSLKWYNVTNTVQMDILPKNITDTVCVDIFSKVVHYHRHSLCGNSPWNGTILLSYLLSKKEQIRAGVHKHGLVIKFAWTHMRLCFWKIKRWSV